MPPRGLMLTRGWLKASHAATKDEALSKPYRPYYRHDTPQPIEPGEIYEFEIEVWATSCCFRKGHRVRIDLACYDSNAFDFGGHYYGLKVGKRHHLSRQRAPVAHRPAGDPLGLTSRAGTPPRRTRSDTMYSKALDPKIMRTMLPPDFPADKLSQPQYKMVVEKDVMIPMRDGVMIAANIYRPDAPGIFPALHAADSYQKDMVTCPDAAHLPLRRGQRHRVLRLPRLRVRAHRLARHRPFAQGRVGLLEPGGADRPLRHDRVDRRAGLVHRQGRHAGRITAGLGAVVRGLPAAPAPGLHPALGRRRRHVPGRRVARRHDGRRLPHRLAHVGDPRALPAWHPGALRHRAGEPG